jgi:aspartyl-tRNA(Asn)/glutamyl-tRNA(Gln) amidotransferase subunit B
MDAYGLSRYDAGLLIETRAKADFYEKTVSPAEQLPQATARGRQRAVANWMNGDFTRLLNQTDTPFESACIAPESLYAMISLIEEGTITGASAKTVFEEMFRSGREPATIVRDLGLEQIGGADEISQIAEAVIAEHDKAVADYRAGKQEAIKFLVGQVMRRSRGRANPETAAEVLRTKLDQQDAN